MLNQITKYIRTINNAIGALLVHADRKCEVLTSDSDPHKRIVGQSAKLREFKVDLDKAEALVAECLRLDDFYIQAVQVTEGKNLRTMTIRSPKDQHGYTFTTEMDEIVRGVSRLLKNLATGLPVAVSLHDYWHKANTLDLIGTIRPSGKRGYRNEKGWGLFTEGIVKDKETGEKRPGLVNLSRTKIAWETLPENANTDNWCIEPWAVWFDNGDPLFRLENNESYSNQIVRAVLHTDSQGRRVCSSIEREVSSRRYKDQRETWTSRSSAMNAVRALFSGNLTQGRNAINRMEEILPAARDKAAQAIKLHREIEEDRDRRRQEEIDQRIEDYKESLRYMGVPEGEIDVDQTTLDAITNAATEAFEASEAGK